MDTDSHRWNGSKNFITRKEVARLLEISVDQVRKNERRLGLQVVRCDLNARCVRYHATPALLILKEKL